MAQAKADRKAAAKKAAATRERNKTKAKSQKRGTKAASTRQGNAAAKSLDQAKKAASGAVSGVTSAAKHAGNAAKEAGKSVATRAKVPGQRQEEVDRVAADHTIVSADEAEDLYAGTDVPGEFRRFTDALGAEQVAVTLIRVPPHSDFEQGTGHCHDEIEELYLVTRGTLTMRFGDEIEQVGAGACSRRPGDDALAPQRGRRAGRALGDLAESTTRTSTKVDDFWEASDQASQTARSSRVLVGRRRLLARRGSGVVDGIGGIARPLRRAACAGLHHVCDRRAEHEHGGDDHGDQQGGGPERDPDEQQDDGQAPHR